MSLLRFCFPDDLQRLNAIKIVLTAVANGVAAILFIAVADVAWDAAGADRGRLDRRRAGRRALRPPHPVRGAALDRRHRRHDRRGHPDLYLSASVTGLMPEQYDCIVIGSGPGGYVAAIRAAQLGMKTAVVEKDNVGGRCLNYACIPAKAVLRVADILSEIDEADEFGIEVPSREVDFAKVSARREKVVKTLTGGVSGLFKKNKIDFIEGVGSLADGGVKVGDETYTASKAIILATGSVPKPVPGTQFGGRVIGTEEAWALEELPKKIAVHRRGRVRLRDRLRLWSPRHRGPALRDARPRAPDRGRRHLQGRRPRVRQAEHQGPHRRAGRERRVPRRQGHVLLRRRDRRGRVPDHRRRPRAGRRGARARGRGRQARPTAA